MNIDRLRRIIRYSEAARGEMDSKIKNFYSFAGMNSDNDMLNIMQIVRTSFRKKGCLIIEIPFADEEIGALCYRGDGLRYVVINTSLPKVNANFAVCHEVYHVFYQGREFRQSVEFADGHYYEHEEEYAANLFAGMLLMPETSFRVMYHKFKTESKGDELDTIIRLMSYYEVPYMAALIRCYELGLSQGTDISGELLDVDSQLVRERFMELWLDVSVLEATGKDDFKHLEDEVRRVGRECIDGSYLNERTLTKVLQNMQGLYSEIKGE